MVSMFITTVGYNILFIKRYRRHFFYYDFYFRIIVSSSVDTSSLASKITWFFQKYCLLMVLFNCLVNSFTIRYLIVSSTCTKRNGSLP